MGVPAFAKTVEEQHGADLQTDKDRWGMEGNDSQNQSCAALAEHMVMEMKRCILKNTNQLL